MGHTSTLRSSLTSDGHLDPFAAFLQPPSNETYDERHEREQRESEEKCVSDKIDEQIRADKALMKKRQKDVVKVLLLGQAESGKSTTLKNFRMKYARTAWNHERASWRAVVQLNLVRSIFTIIETLETSFLPHGGISTNVGSGSSTPVSDLSPVSPNAGKRTSTTSPKILTSAPLPTSLTTAAADDPYGFRLEDCDDVRLAGSAAEHSQTLASIYSASSLPPSSPIPGPGTAMHQRTGTISNRPSLMTLTETHQNLINRLTPPLRSVELHLKRHLGAGTEEVVDDSQNEMHATPFDADVTYPPPPVVEQQDEASGTVIAMTASSSLAKEIVERRRREFMVRCWPSRTGPGTNGVASSNNGDAYARDDADVEARLRQVTETMASMRENMKALWKDVVVRELVRKRKVKLQDGTASFLEDIDRITQPFYEPTDDDVVRCRLRTTGVQEYSIRFDDETSSAGTGGSKFSIDFGKEWVMYDVGGARTHRYAWLPYFENVNAIIFLAPISCFDERLLEDSRINRLEDSFILWKAVVSSKLLPKTTMIVFMNKCDILKKKLEMEKILVKKHLPSFGDRKNDMATVVKYLRDKFKDISKQFSPEPRANYLYSTSVIDTKATSTTLKSVRDGILREHLARADFV